MSGIDNLLSELGIDEDVKVTAPKSENYALETLKNIPGSTLQFVDDITTPFRKPIETAKNLYGLGESLVQLAIPGEQGNEELARQMGGYLADRYGGLENVKNTFKKDPVGLVSDVALLFTGVGAGVKVAGNSGKISKIGSQVNEFGKKIDPATYVFKGAGKTAELTGKGLNAVKETNPISQLFAKTTGTGSDALATAYNVGKVGGEQQQIFRDALTGKTDINDTVNKTVDKIKSEKKRTADEFTTSKDNLSLEEIPMDFRGVEEVITKFKVQNAEKGFYTLSGKGQKKLKIIDDIVDEFRTKPYLHNAKGFDMLKRRIQEEYPTGIKIGDSGLPSVNIANGIKDLIVKKVPEYKPIMDSYAKSTKEIQNIQKTLGADSKLANKPGAIGKLQNSLLQSTRDGVNANFKYKADAVNKLDPNLMPELSGLALQNILPRGLAGLSTSGLGLGAYGTLGVAGIPLALSSSPRLMGNVANRSGQVVGSLAKGMDAVSPYTKPIGSALMNYGPDALRINRPITQADPSGLLEAQEQRSEYDKANQELLRLINGK